MTELVKMIREDGKTADVHPDMVADYIKGGYVEGEPKEPITRESIGEMKKADALELLELHGIENAKGGVKALREQLINIMFVGG